MASGEGSHGSTHLEGRAEAVMEASSDKTGTHLLRSSYHQHPQRFSHRATPSIHCSPPVLCSSAPCTLFQGCAHVYCAYTTSLQTRDLCYLPTAGTLSDFSSLPGQDHRSGIDQKLKTSSKPDHQESVDSLLLTTNPQ